MALTPRGIFSPDSTDGYDVTVDWAATADSIESALDQASNYGVGTTAERTAALAGFPNGAKWYDTTTSEEYRKVAGVWAVYAATGTATAVAGYTLASHLARVGPQVTLVFNITKTDGSNVPTFTPLLTIPVGFRPLMGATFGASAVKTAVSDYIATVLVTTSGDLQLARAEGGVPVNKVAGGVSWITA